MFQPTWHCCMCCNLANGRVDFEDGWLIKSSFIPKDEHEACQLTRTKVQQQKKNFRFLKILQFCSSDSRSAEIGAKIVFNFRSVKQETEIDQKGNQCYSFKCSNHYHFKIRLKLKRYQRYSFKCSNHNNFKIRLKLFVKRLSYRDRIKTGGKVVNIRHSNATIIIILRSD
jgi:hypothetical protein